ncbi:MutS-related protein [Clostridium butyricum]|uniref:MutS-related protein n=1 Tax=Clostridium butyricum TaxID=1492 RepID=UPI0002CA24B2|nr:MutS domain protein [Clostridium butyricum]EMU55842.1 MutS domain protein [Clostridium butyricum DKU-01]
MSISVSESFLKNDLYSTKSKRRDLNKVKLLFDYSKRNNFTIDDQTWNDLIMDNVFNELDSTYSAEGEAALYRMLRNPIINEEELNKRGKLIDLFKKDTKLTVNLRRIFFEMRYDKKNRLIEMISGLLSVSKLKYYLYTIFGLTPILWVLAAIILREPKMIIILMFDIYIKIYVHNKERDTINAIGIVYLRELINAGQILCNNKNDEVKSYTGKIKEILNDLNTIDKSTYLLKLTNSFWGIIDMLSVPFFIQESIYYKISGKLIEKKDTILELYYLVGEIDALVSIAIYQSNNEGKYSKPKFIKETSLKIKDGVHPLLKNPVSNSIEISGKGVVLTGTNMSGKSTFLRMVSTNILFAQTFNFILGKEYEACFFNMVSSISPKDDIVNGKSYYLSEAESILRIIKASQKDIPVFCPIDEIFRGTNPIERIASSAEILRYLNKGNAICIVATHDREISDMLKENYDFYYFSEEVDSKSGLKFDYKLKRGVSKTRNAIKLLEYIGYPKEIIENSYIRMKKIEGFV